MNNKSITTQSPESILKPLDIIDATSKTITCTEAIISAVIRQFILDGEEESFSLSDEQISSLLWQVETNLALIQKLSDQMWDEYKRITDGPALSTEKNCR